MDVTALRSVSVPLEVSTAARTAIRDRLIRDATSETSIESIVAPGSATPIAVRLTQGFVRVIDHRHEYEYPAITWIATTAENAPDDVSAILGSHTPAVVAIITATAAATLSTGALLGAGAWRVLADVVFAEAGDKRVLLEAVTGDRTALAIGDTIAIDVPPANITADVVVSAVRVETNVHTLTSWTAQPWGSNTSHRFSHSHTELRRGGTTLPLVIVADPERAGTKLEPLDGYRVHVDVAEPYTDHAQIIDSEAV